MPHHFETPRAPGERLARLETVVEHLSAGHHTHAQHHIQHTEAVSRLSLRMERQEAAMHGVYRALEHLKDVPTRVAEQTRDTEARRRQKEERRETRKEALALVKWVLTFLLIIAAAFGVIPEPVLKTATSALGLGR